MRLDEKNDCHNSSNYRATFQCFPRAHDSNWMCGTNWLKMTDIFEMGIFNDAKLIAMRIRTMTLILLLIIQSMEMIRKDNPEAIVLGNQQ